MIKTLLRWQRTNSRHTYCRRFRSRIDFLIAHAHRLIIAYVSSLSARFWMRSTLNYNSDKKSMKVEMEMVIEGSPNMFLHQTFENIIWMALWLCNNYVIIYVINFISTNAIKIHENPFVCYCKMQTSVDSFSINLSHFWHICNNVTVTH